MPEITPSFVMEYERRMRAITEDEYVRRLKKLWWNKVARPMPIEGKTERVAWLLDTATIEPIGPTGTGRLGFEDMVSLSVEYPTFRHGKGIRVQRDQIEDLDGTGLDVLAKWSSNIGNETAYYPQRLLAQILLNGTNADGSANAYDGVPFFSDYTNPHPNNPYDPTRGYYANWLHGSATVGTPTFTPSGYGPIALPPNPGACAIDDSVTPENALINLGKAIAYIASLKMPNGVDPRFLSVAYMIVPPRMAPRVRQLTSAKLIAQTAGSGGGGADVEALIRGWELGEPVVAAELAASTNYAFKMAFVDANGNDTFLPESSIKGSDTTYYIVCQEMQTTKLGGLLLVQRKPFKVNYYTGDSGGTGMTEQLDRQNEFEYHVQGRMAPAYGHPYTIFRCDNS